MIETGWLPEEAAAPLWNDLLTLLDMAAAHGDGAPFDPDDLLWIASEDGMVIGAVTTRLPDEGAAELKNIAGIRGREWIPALEAKICGWARDAGKDRIVSRGRAGWRRIVSGMGWRVTGEANGLTLFEKVLQ